MAKMTGSLTRRLAALEASAPVPPSGLLPEQFVRDLMKVYGDGEPGDPGPATVAEFARVVEEVYGCDPD